MAAPPSPLAIANAAVRNAVPLAGILFLGWSAASVLVLYFADTLLAMAVIFAGLARSFMPPPREAGWAARANAEAGCVGVALFLAGFMAVPLGVPVLILFAASGTSWRAVLADPMFRSGLVLQGIAAFWSCLGLYRALATRTPEQLRIRRQFSLLFLRWIAVLMAFYLPLALLLGAYAPLACVLVYTAATFMIEVAPDRFLRAMPGGAEDADPLPANARTPPAPAPEEGAKYLARWRRRHRK